jgi:hypothetical protein
VTATIDRPTSTTTTSTTTTGNAAEGQRPSRRWALWGAAAGVSAFVATMAGMAKVAEEDYDAGPEIIQTLHRGGYHVSFVLGLLSVGLLLVAANAWKRWSEHTAPDDLAARTISTGLTATATINVIGYALAGSMALYLPGGMDEGMVNDQMLFHNYSYNDFGLLFGWWGTVVAAVCVAVLAFRRRRVLPRWMGVTSVVLLAVPVVTALITALPGLPGFFMPIWLTVISVGMARSRRIPA